MKNLDQSTTIQKRVGIQYPDSYDALWDFPVRVGKRGYQVWNGEKWLPVEIREV